MQKKPSKNDRRLPDRSAPDLPVAPAILIRGQIVEGFGLHAQCWVIAHERGLCPAPGAPDAEWNAWMQAVEFGVEEGFVTAAGQFLDREDAYATVEAAGLLKDYETHCAGALHAPDLEVVP